MVFFHSFNVFFLKSFQLKWEAPNEEQLIKFLVEEKGFRLAILYNLFDKIIHSTVFFFFSFLKSCSKVESFEKADFLI